ncbi:MAG: D-alanyl-D-alanine carboxypeptidase, partial [Actinobacteria bacterium]|nr:D-alanyl-D-alanine carboxypeptidase [Actinomycetota bacterium]
MRRAALVLAAAAALVVAAGAPAAPPRVQAAAYLVQNATTGEVLASRNARERRPPASITKLMTVLVALERARLDEVVTVTNKAAAVGESSIFLEPGERITVADLVRAALIQSANDAAYALATHVGVGSVPRFVALMNAKARALGLSDTRFVNPDGLDAPGHVSSARDVTRLARVAMRNPFVRETVQLQSTSIAGDRTLRTWNDLLATFPALIGVKTGHTDDAGWSEVAAARGPGVTIYATLLGGVSRERRNADLASLLRWGLSRFRTVAAI